MADKRLMLDCDCATEIVVIDYFAPFKEDSEAWYIEFFSAIPRGRTWKDRLRVIWGVLRGRETYLDVAVFSRDNVKRLRDFCNDCLK